MKTKLFFALLCFLWIQSNNAQTVHYSQGYQRPNLPSADNLWKDAKVDAQGNAYMLGYFSVSRTFNGQLYTVPDKRKARMLVKHDSLGQILWVATTGNAEGDVGEVLLLDAEDHPIVIGSISQVDNVGAVRGRIAVSKYNKSDGALLSQNIATQGVGNIMAATTTTNGNIYIVVDFSNQEPVIWDDAVSPFISTGSHPFILKIDASGRAKSFLRAKTDNGDIVGKITGITSDGNNDIYIVGNSTQSGALGLFVSKMDSLANNVWHIKTGSSKDNDFGYSVIFHQGAVYASGRVGWNAALNFGNGVSSPDKFPQSFVVKISPEGEAIWMRRNLQDGGNDFHLRKLASLHNGHIITFGTFRGANVSFAGYSMTSSGHLLYPQFNQIDGIVCELDTAGQLLKFFHTAGGWVQSQTLAAAPDNSVWIGGFYQGTIKIGSTTHQGYGGANDHSLYVARVTPGVISTTGVATPAAPAALIVYPNPANDHIYIKSSAGSNAFMELHDVRGRIMLSQPLSPQENANHSIDLTSFEEGVYFISIHADNQIESKKFVITR
jgi:hypothetical protein